MSGVEPEPFEMGEHLVEASGKLSLLDSMLAHLQEGLVHPPVLWLPLLVINVLLNVFEALPSFFFLSFFFTSRPAGEGVTGSCCSPR